MPTISSYVSSAAAAVWARPVFYSTVAIVIVGGAFFLFSGEEAERKLLAVSAGDFVQEVSVSGTVVAAEDVDLGFTQTGRVASVRAAVGGQVSAGTVLASLENGDLAAAVQQRRAALERERAKLEQLRSGTRQEEIAVKQSAVAEAEIALGRADEALIDELRDAYTTADDAVRNTADQLFSNPRTNPQLTFQVADTSHESAVESERPLLEARLASWQGAALSLSASSDLAIAVSEARSNLSAVSDFLADVNNALNSAIITLSFTQATADAHKASIASARSGINTASSALTSAVTAQKNAAASLETAKRNLALAAAGTVSTDIAAQEAQVRAAEADVQSAQAQLAKTVITAPFSGTVTTVDIKRGEIASANAPVVSLIGGGTFQIESFVPEVNIALLAVGDNAVVTLDAYGERETFAARIVSIDPAETIRDGVSTYRALLQFDAPDGRIRTGMTANVRITTEEKSGIIAVPQGIVVERSGKKYVEVLEGETVVEREVTTGSVSSLGNIEIISGLADGETVVLSE